MCVCVCGKTGDQISNVMFRQSPVWSYHQLLSIILCTPLRVSFPCIRGKCSLTTHINTYNNGTPHDCKMNDVK